MNRPQGRWLRFVYKRIVAGDIRKLSAESADAGTGGGARDLRFNPAEKFWPVFERMFSAATTKKCLDARLIWDGEITNTEVYPPTSARPNEARITRVNACCPTKLIPSDNEEFIFILIQGEDGVHASFMTKQQVLDNRFSLGLESVLIRAIEYSETTKVPIGFVDLENHVQYSSIGDVMNMVMFHPYLVREDILAAIRTKPFILLAGISGTGKSRLVRQLARGLCPRYKAGSTTEDHPLYNKKKPGNFEMIQVRPNWHDSTQLIGYESRVSGKAEFVVKPFVKFLAKAWLYEEEGVPFFLCLDEMNLAPVEQYFAEYLSIIETRKMVDGKIATDPLVTFPNEALMREAFKEIYQGVDHDRAEQFINKFIAEGGISIPRNFVVMGTVNMDETTFSFSRKVLDRAMSFELNEVDMDGGLTADPDYDFGSIDMAAAKCEFTQGFEVYSAAQADCDKIKTFLVDVNKVLDKTPFKIAYRTRNEIMVYCHERGKYGVPLAQALDEATSMKILSRVEGDKRRLVIRDAELAEYNGKPLLDSLLDVILKGLKTVRGGEADYTESNVCSRKLQEMIGQLENGYTSFWTR